MQDSLPSVFRTRWCGSLVRMMMMIIMVMMMILFAVFLERSIVFPLLLPKSSESDWGNKIIAKLFELEIECAKNKTHYYHSTNKLFDI